MFRIPLNSPSVIPSQTSQANERVNIYLGDGGTPQKNDFMSLLGSYVHRVSNSTKDLKKYPIVFASEAAHSKFQLYKEKTIQEYGIIRPHKTGRSDDDVGSHFIYALQNVSTYHASNFQFNDNQKIYVHGHGGAGKNSLQVDHLKLTMNEVVKTLSDMGVPKTVKDIRLTSCYSADTKPINNIKDPDLKTYSESFIKKSTFLGIAINEETVKAPAAHLLDALNDAGYNNVTVTGYHGAGMYYNGNNFPEHSLRSTVTPSAPTYKPEDTVKRSTVSEKFISEID
ncbi:hypothetical protein M5X66_17940 (plasmid) [Providencia sp. PROV188]|uniref:hypothetical protein n=1 Tax=Providencia TaxID=586 RepID=UPI0003E1F20F|nr:MULTISPECIES: hypothetical protein [Providencia]UNJ79517.1 hypothetical protein [Providencia sp.]ETT01149.1 hypothetical protein HMPREF1568_3855 [Providencia alcalifaciens PAL-3]EUC99197.1 hypothetical protein HMPREF1566_3831 [Providencia alcalifaciens PAL-1]MTC48531.1 hypothetical protein [Providencia alcalifaciens]WBM62643.1 hypothetical protein M5X66_17940 [Providencia sp. PROV188]